MALAGHSNASLPTQKPPAHWQFHVIQLRPERDVLEGKIRKRLQNMIATGALEEVGTLSAKIDAGEVPEDALVTVAHGFRHFRCALKGTITMDEAMESTAIETRQYTKRQRTWLRHQIRADEIV